MCNSVLLYGCEIWLLDSFTILLLEKFQSYYSEYTEEYLSQSCALCLNLPSMACHILIRKLTVLGKLLDADKYTISSTLFTA